MFPFHISICQRISGESASGKVCGQVVLLGTDIVWTVPQIHLDFQQVSTQEVSGVLVKSKKPCNKASAEVLPEDALSILHRRFRIAGVTWITWMLVLRSLFL